MLTKKQWQWIADHHKTVRLWMIGVAFTALGLYVALMMKTTLDKGKAQTPYKAATNFHMQFGCKDKLSPFDMGPLGGNAPPKPGFYEDASIYRLERHYTYMLDAEALLRFPECIGAMVADNANAPDPFVFLIYDRHKGRVVYRIARLDDVLRR